MKKLFSRKIFAMLAAVTLVTAALVTSCNNPIEGKVQGEQEDDFTPFDPPAGMGYIRVKVANNARTILPSLPNPSTLAYRILVEDEGAGMNVIYDSDTKNGGDPIPYASLATYPILIAQGNYTVTVTAYANTAAAPTVYNQQVGYDQVEHVSVPASGGKTVTITLKPSMTTGGTPKQGKFSYNIALPSNKGDASGTFSATLTVTVYPGGGTTTINGLDLVPTGANNNTASPTSLNAGFYLVTIAMTDPGVPAIPGPEELPALQNRTITNILHIYDNITTSYTPTLPDLNPYRYTVTYNANGGNGLSATSFGPYAHGSTLSLASNAPTTPTHAPTTPATVFDGWARDVTNNTTTAATKWSFSDDVPTPANPTKLIGPITLYAAWKQADIISLTINWTNMTDIVFSQTATFNQSKYYSGTTQTATLDFVEPGYTVVKWIDGSGADLGAGPVTLSNSSSTSYFTPGPHYFTALIESAEYLDPGTDTILNPNYHAGETHNITFTLTVAP